MNNTKRGLIIFLIIICILPALVTLLYADVPDYYTGLGKSYDVAYYSYFYYEEGSNEYIFADRLPTVDLEFGTFYKVISDRDNGQKIVGAFYLNGKLNWALTYNSGGDVVRIEKYNELGELEADKHYTGAGELYFETTKGKQRIHKPHVNRRSSEDIRYVYAYFTKGGEIEVIDRREVTKWFPEEDIQYCIRDKYYNARSGKLVKESVFNEYYKHLYDIQYYYSGTGEDIQYAEYYSENEFIESVFYFYEGDKLSEIEYRGREDKDIVREIFDEEGNIKEIIEYYEYYVPEIKVEFDNEGLPVYAEYNRYDDTFRLTKKHEYKFNEGKFVKEKVVDVFGNMLEEVEYSYTGDNLTAMKRKSLQGGDDYTINVSYTFDRDGNIKGSSALSYVFGPEGEIIEASGSSSGRDMLYYENIEGNLNIDVYSGNSGVVYNGEEKSIAVKLQEKEAGGNSLITISNRGVITMYEKELDDIINVIHFDNSKPVIIEHLSKENRSLLYREYYDEGGNKYRTVSYDPENYKENFIEYDSSGNKISEYRLDAEGSLIEKLYYDSLGRPYKYEKYNTFGSVVEYSIRTYHKKTGDLLNYSIYKYFGEEGFRLSSVQIYNKGDMPDIVVIFDDVTHMISTIQYHDNDGEKERFIWRKINSLNINEEQYDYTNEQSIKYTYRFANKEASNNDMTKEHYYYNIK